MNNEDKLPKWAQGTIGELRREICQLKLRLAEIEKAHDVLVNRSWFTISGPPESVDNNGKSAYHLWFLDRDDPLAAFSLNLNRGDILLIGRRKHET